MSEAFTKNGLRSASHPISAAAQACQAQRLFYTKPVAPTRSACVMVSCELEACSIMSAHAPHPPVICNKHIR
eukprot:5748181-Amphidinium_carterae.1